MSNTKNEATQAVEDIRLEELMPFPGNPFSVRESEEFNESIRDYGIISPLVVRPREGGVYEVISGHRRMAAAHKAGLETVPAFVRVMDDNAAVIALVDSNIHRENILPSEKAFAYKMKLDAIKRQGERTDLSGGSTSRQAVGKLESADIVGQGASESGRQVQRYVRLTELIPQILEMVDDSRMAFTPAVEISYLEPRAQEDLLEAMQLEDRTPSLPQCQRMRQLLSECRLDRDIILEIMAEEKPNQKEQIKLKTDSIRGFFPKGYSPMQMEQVIMKLLADWQRQRERAARNRDAR